MRFMPRFCALKALVIFVQVALSTSHFVWQGNYDFVFRIDDGTVLNHGVLCVF
jgi:hypothetical protein